MNSTARHLNDKTALITGASGGIGLEFARILSRNKVNLILVARGEDKLKSLAAELEKADAIQTLVIKADLTDQRMHARGGELQ